MWTSRSSSNVSSTLYATRCRKALMRIPRSARRPSTWRRQKAQSKSAMGVETVSVWWTEKGQSHSLVSYSLDLFLPILSVHVLRCYPSFNFPVGRDIPSRRRYLIRNRVVDYSVLTCEKVLKIFQWLSLRSWKTTDDDMKNKNFTLFPISLLRVLGEFCIVQCMTEVVHGFCLYWYVFFFLDVNYCFFFVYFDSALLVRVLRRVVNLVAILSFRTAIHSTFCASIWRSYYLIFFSIEELHDWSLHIF